MVLLGRWQRCRRCSGGLCPPNSPRREASPQTRAFVAAGKPAAASFGAHRAPLQRPLDGLPLFVSNSIKLVNQLINRGVGGGDFAPGALACSAPAGRLIESNAPSSRTEPFRSAFMLRPSASTRSASSMSQRFDGVIAQLPEGSAHRCSSTTSLSISR